MRPHGRASVSSSNPKAFGICDRCGFMFNHHALRFQHDYRGRSLQNLRILVCETCLDKPQPQLKPIILSPDPVPIKNPRPQPAIKNSPPFVPPSAPSTPTVNPAYLVDEQGEILVDEFGNPIEA